MQVRRVLDRALTWIYYIFGISLTWLIGIILGLGIFSLYPATVVAFHLWKKVREGYDVERMRIFTIWWEAYREEMKSNWWLSLILVALAFVLFINFSYLAGASGFLTLILYYVTLILLFFYGLFFFWLVYIRANNLTENRLEAVRNALLLPGASLLESLILIVLGLAVLIIIWNLSIALFILTGPGLLFLMVDFAYSQIIQGKLILSYLKNWWKTRE